MATASEFVTRFVIDAVYKGAGQLVTRVRPEVKA
jgi:hypothetical protein